MSGPVVRLGSAAAVCELLVMSLGRYTCTLVCRFAPVKSRGVWSTRGCFSSSISFLVYRLRHFRSRILFTCGRLNFWGLGPRFRMVWDFFFRCQRPRWLLFLAALSSLNLKLQRLCSTFLSGLSNRAATGRVCQSWDHDVMTHAIYLDLIVAHSFLIVKCMPGI